MNDIDNMPPSAQRNVPEFSVSDLAGAIKRTIEDQFGQVRVRAEISGLSRPRSGHLYFTLKDESSTIDGVMWRGVASRLSFQPEDGLEVICTGKLTTYGARSKYQIVVERMEPAGAGALMALLEARKKQLASEGLFDPARKQALPLLPRHIGIVTSPTGAVIRDILHRLADRFPTRVTVWPVKVQGEGADREIANGIRGLNDMKGADRPDLIIVARGGGSLEDLWSFNEEIVVRAAAASHLPLISAVGHETDTTLIDYASDRRAPTPTGAAEIAVPVRADLISTVADFSYRLDRAVRESVRRRQERVEGLARGLPKPRDILGLSSQRVDDLSQRLPVALKSRVSSAQIALSRSSAGLSHKLLQSRLAALGERLEGYGKRTNRAIKTKIERDDTRLQNAGRLLNSLGYHSVLERGFALVRDESGGLVSTVQGAGAAGRVRLTFKDGDTMAEVYDQSSSTGDVAQLMETKPPQPKGQRRTQENNKATRKNQGELF